MAMVRIHKETFKRSFLYTFLLGFLAHGYGFLHFQPSHDSLAEVVSDRAYWKWKLELGRYLKILYDLVLGKFTSFPWINGIMALVWLSLVAFLVVEMLDLKKKSQIAVVCGILSTNVTVTAVASTYAPDLGSDMCALALAALGAFIWTRMTACEPVLKKRTAVICEIAIGICVAASLALYQPFIFAYTTMVMVVSILRCLQYPKMSLKKIWSSDFLAAGAALLGGGMYYIGLKTVGAITGISLIQDNYNSVSNAWTNTEPLMERVMACWRQFKSAFTEMPDYVYSYPITRLINLLLLSVLVLCLVGSILRLAKKKHAGGCIATLLLLIVLLPFSMDGVRLLSTFVHTLMIYSFWLIYVLVFCVAVHVTENTKAKWIEPLATLLLCGVLLTNVQTANACYVKKTTEQEATLSVMTRVVDRMESTEGYKPGITPAVFLGTPADYLKTFEPFEEIESIVGLNANASVTYLRAYALYFQMIMRVNVNIVYDLSDFDLDEDTCGKTMPCFPAEDSIQMINGVMIVKFGDWFPE